MKSSQVGVVLGAQTDHLHRVAVLSSDLLDVVTPDGRSVKAVPRTTQGSADRPGARSCVAPNPRLG
jgi:hypothetical protein